jgi:hypothetical protein
MKVLHPWTRMGRENPAHSVSPELKGVRLGQHDDPPSVAVAGVNGEGDGSLATPQLTLWARSVEWSPACGSKN